MLLLVISPSVNSVDSSLVRGSLYLCNLLNAVLQSDFVITLKHPNGCFFHRGKPRGIHTPAGAASGSFGMRIVTSKLSPRSFFCVSAAMPARFMMSTARSTVL